MTSLAIQGNNFTYGQYQLGGQMYMAEGMGIGRTFKSIKKTVGKVTDGIQDVAKDLAKSKIISKTLMKAAPIAGLIPGVGELAEETLTKVGETVQSVGGRKMRGGAKNMKRK